MKDNRYIGHNLRSFFIYLLIFYSYDLIYGLNVSLNDFIYGLIAYALSYSPVYFLNDFADFKEDKKYKRNNLYNDIENKEMFWLIFGLVIFSGLLLAVFISIYAFFGILILYGLNILYSLKPFRLRQYQVMASISFFLIYFFKWFAVSAYMKLDDILDLFPWSLALVTGAFAAYSNRIYKRYQKVTPYSEIFWLIVMTLILVMALYQYPEVFWLFFPILPVLILIRLLFNRKQIPVIITEVLYFVHLTVVYLILR